MTAFMIAFCVALALALTRVATSFFEGAFYLLENGEYGKALFRFNRGLLCVLLVALLFRPVVDFFVSIEVQTFDVPTKVSKYNKV